MKNYSDKPKPEPSGITEREKLLMQVAREADRAAAQIPVCRICAKPSPKGDPCESCGITDRAARDKYFCSECYGRLIPNPMEGGKNSWMHFDGKSDCKLRGKNAEYISKHAAISEESAAPVEMLVKDGLITHVFDKHVMLQKQITLEQLCDWIRTIEPPEEPATASELTERDFEAVSASERGQGKPGKAILAGS